MSKQFSLLIAVTMIAALAMADSFTVLTNGVSWQHKDVWNEILTTYNEVRAVAGWSGASLSLIVESELLESGSDLQEHNFTRSAFPYFYTNRYELVQQNIERLIASGKYVDTSIPATNFTTAQAYSITSLWVAAGMTTNGWRRATDYDPAVNNWTDQEDAMYAYGKMQAGDIIGNWIWSDLQSCLLLMDTVWKQHASDPPNFNTAIMSRTAISSQATTNLSELTSLFTNSWASASVKLDDFTDGNFSLNRSWYYITVGINPQGWYEASRQEYRNCAYALNAQENRLVNSNCVVKVYSVVKSPEISTSTSNYFSNPILPPYNEGDVIELETTYVANPAYNYTQQWETAYIFDTNLAAAASPATTVDGAYLSAANYPSPLAPLSEGVKIMDAAVSWWQVKFPLTYTD